MDPFNPVFALWFLLTLFCFHVILVIVRRYKAYYVLPVALIISILAGFLMISMVIWYFKNNRIFPDFYVGYLTTRAHTQLLRNKN